MVYELDYLFLVRLLSRVSIGGSTCSLSLPVAKALTRRGKLAQLMPYHFLGDGDGKMELAIVYEEFESGVNALLKTYPTKFGRIVQLRAFVRMGALFFRAC